MTDETSFHADGTGSDGLIHWWSRTGATHAVIDVANWHGTTYPEEVTCETCRAHILNASVKRAGVRINDRMTVHVRQVGSTRPKTRCGTPLRAPNKIEDIADVDALPPEVKRCRNCFPGSSRMP